MVLRRAPSRPLLHRKLSAMWTDPQTRCSPGLERRSACSREGGLVSCRCPLGVAAPAAVDAVPGSGLEGRCRALVIARAWPGARPMLLQGARTGVATARNVGRGREAACRPRRQGGASSRLVACQGRPWVSPKQRRCVCLAACLVVELVAEGVDRDDQRGAGPRLQLPRLRLHILLQRGGSRLMSGAPCCPPLAIPAPKQPGCRLPARCLLSHWAGRPACLPTSFTVMALSSAARYASRSHVWLVVKRKS